MDEILKIIFPHKGYIATPILIYLNGLIFLAMVFLGFGFLSFGVDALTEWGANSRPLVARGDWWRLFSYQFLHADSFHILGNMTGLFLAGLILEPQVGTGRFILVYLASGIIAGLASIGCYETTPSVGASGAIFGLYGLALALIQNKLFPSDWKYVFLITAASMAGYGFLIGLFGGIDNAAHFGGLLTGYILGLEFTPAIRKRVVAQVRQSPESDSNYRY
ncbi:MAG: rhomboid family intramembrane serine protease [Prevotellaceae bacterium]|jgi:membrane associated rhomboid family serine protease|nr:rhomboid family intramembrane serine protease [Prevotellaceae bacterium]